MQTRIPEVGEVIAGKYRLVRQLGQGATGLVYEAEQLILQRSVAIKLVSLQGAPSNLASEFIGRARAASQLDHPGFARLMDSGKTQDGFLYAVSELLLGGDLQANMAGRGPLSEEQAGSVVVQLLDAISAMHARGLVHGDLTPRDILVIDPGDENHPPQVKLGDLGLARVGPTDARDLHPFTAPELEGGQPVNERTDIYACGAILGWLLSGQMPSRSDPNHTSDSSHTQFAEIVARATKSAPGDRYASARVMKNDLQAALDETMGIPTSSRSQESLLVRKSEPIPMPVLPFEPAPRRGWIWILALLILAGIGAGGWYWWTHNPEKQLAQMMSTGAHGAAETFALDNFDRIKNFPNATRLVLQAMKARRNEEISKHEKLRFESTYSLSTCLMTGLVRYQGQADRRDPFEMRIESIDGHRIRGTFTLPSGGIRATVVGYWDGNHILFWDDAIEWAESPEHRKSYVTREKTNLYIINGRITGVPGVYGSWLEGELEPLPDRGP